MGVGSGRAARVWQALTSAEHGRVAHAADPVGGWRQAMFLVVQMVVGIGGAIFVPIYLGTHHASTQLYLQIVIGTFVTVLVIALRVAWLVQGVVRTEDNTSERVESLMATAVKLASGQDSAIKALKTIETASRTTDLVNHDLLQLQQSLARLEYEERSNGTLLMSIIAGEIIQVRDRASDAALHLRVLCRPDNSSIGPLLESLSPDTSCSLFHYADNNEWFLQRSGHSFDFNLDLANRVKNHRLSTIRRIIVVKSREELLDPATWVLALFHQDCPNFDYRLVGARRLQRKIIEVLPHLTDQYNDRVDFGIYGEHYIYVSRQDPASKDVVIREEPRGMFSANKQEIRRYQRFFDSIWDLDIRLPLAIVNAVAEHIRVAGGGRMANSRGVVNEFEDLPDVVSQCYAPDSSPRASAPNRVASISHLLTQALQEELDRFGNVLLQ